MTFMLCERERRTAVRVEEIRNKSWPKYFKSFSWLDFSNVCDLKKSASLSLRKKRKKERKIWIETNRQACCLFYYLTCVLSRLGVDEKKNFFFEMKTKKQTNTWRVRNLSLTAAPAVDLLLLLAGIKLKWEKKLRQFLAANWCLGL